MNGYEGLRQSAAVLDLSARGKLRLSGEDRARLLHAMSTNDVEHLQPGAGVYAFFLSAQGRILADAAIYNRGDSLFLDTEPETAHSLPVHLDKYIIADDVTIDDLTESWGALAIEGPDAAAVAAKHDVPAPGEPFSTVSFGDGFVARAASAGVDGVRIFLPRESCGRLTAQLGNAGLPTASVEEAEAVRLENKKPRYGADLSERYLVHETQQLHGVHFSKGCYIGQEIVERVRSQGKVHRLLTPIAATGTRPPASGTKLFVAGKEVGEVTSAAWSPALQQVVGFAYLRGEGLEPSRKLEIEDGSVAEQASIRL